jgi:hypothetical protein
VGDVLERAVGADAVDHARPERQRRRVGDHVALVLRVGVEPDELAQAVAVEELRNALGRERRPRAELEVHGADVLGRRVGRRARVLPPAPVVRARRVDAPGHDVAQRVAALLELGDQLTGPFGVERPAQHLPDEPQRAVARVGIHATGR